MKKALIFVIFIVLVIVAVLIFDQKIMGRPKTEENKKVREPAVAGQFYPGSKIELESLIDEYFKNVPDFQIEGRIRALIVPHAGYEYSGQVAAYGYKAIANADFKRVILIGNSHQEYFDGLSVWNSGYFRTPLGDIEIDEDFAKKLIDSNSKIIFRESAHISEHSLEVQLPFLQKILPASGWKIVPIILGNQESAVDILINALKDLIDDHTLIIASSDLSHYPKYEDAQYSDNKVIEAILSGKRENLQKIVSDLEKEGIDNLQTCACGQDSIEVVMGLVGDKNIKLLNAANSGDITGDKSQVVGYAAIGFFEKQNELNKTQQKRLLEIAKQAVETYVKEGKIIKIEEKDELLSSHQGVFVTLEKNEQLRGCVGVFSAQGGPASGGEPLYQNVIEMAISAAVNDPRFSPVSKSELKDLSYEVSVLSPLEKVDSWEKIEIGKHGVQIRKGNRGGVFLPQVATENNWDRETFLSVLCSGKAGLLSDCYKDKDTEIYIFTAQVFGEK